MTEANWIEISNCAMLGGAFDGLDAGVAAALPAWRGVFESGTAHRDPLPGEWAGLSSFQTLLVMRAVRPDKVCEAIQVRALHPTACCCGANRRLGAARSLLARHKSNQIRQATVVHMPSHQHGPSILD
jgi:hypothetical protein